METITRSQHIKEPEVLSLDTFSELKVAKMCLRPGFCTGPHWVSLHYTNPEQWWHYTRLCVCHVENYGVLAGWTFSCNQKEHFTYFNTMALWPSHFTWIERLSVTKPLVTQSVAQTSVGSLHFLLCRPTLFSFSGPLLLHTWWPYDLMTFVT